MADRRIKTILDAQIDGLQKGLRDSAKAARDAAKDLDDLERRAKALDSLKSKVEVEADAEKAEQAMEKIGDQLAKIDGESVSADVRVDSGKAEAAVGEVSDQLAKIDGESATAKVSADTGKAESSLGSIAGQVAKLDGEGARVKVDADTGGAVGVINRDIPSAGKLAGGKAGGLLGGGLASGLKLGLGALGGVAVAAGAALGMSLWASIQRGMEIHASQGMFSARTGLDAATAAKFGRAAGTAYSQGWGESVESNMSAARSALQNGLLSGSDTQAAISDTVSKLTAVSDIIGADIPEAAEAAGAMIKGKLAKNASEAFDVIVSGYQRGADRSGDFMDTLREYSSMFQSLGLDGPKSVGLISQAMEAGARTSDLAADALKEFSIRAQDGSKTTAEGYKLLGLNAEQMTKAVAAGGPAAEKALGQTLDALRKIEDPVKQNTAGVALFGTQWEDLGNGAGILAMDLQKLGGAWGESAGAAERAMSDMSNNTAAKMESAKRSVEVAMDGIAGALASAFAGDLDGMATWVSENRATMMQFAIDTLDALVGVGRGMSVFVGMMIRGGGLAAGALAPIVHSAGLAVEALGRLTNNQTMVKFGQDVMASASGMAVFGRDADKMATDVTNSLNGALDKTEAKAKSWAGGELVAAQISDAVAQSSRRLGELATAIDNTKGTVTINGQSMDAQKALDLMVDNINEADGTVTINGDRIPAGQALDTMIGLVNSGKGTITIGGNNAPARGAAEDAARYAGSRQAMMTIDASGAAALREAELIRRRIESNPAYIPVRSSSNIARADGGWVPGRAAGGWVPGPYPGKGKDNILWPLAYGGQTLNQPLAGREFVVNAVSSAQWAPFLEGINSGRLSPDSLLSPVMPGASGPLDLTEQTVQRLAAAMIAGATAASAGHLSRATADARRRSIQMGV